MTQTEALKLALDKKAENALELGLDYEPENTLHWHALNYRTAPTQNAQKMFAALEKFVEDAIKEALAQQCVCGEPDSAGTHRTDGPCFAPQPEHDIDELCAKHNKIGYKHGYRAGKADEREKQSKASLSQPLVGTLLYLFREWKEDHLSQHNYIEAIEAIMDAHGIKE